MNQLGYCNVVELISPEDTTKEDNNRALQYLTFLKQKQCERIKSRGCVKRPATKSIYIQGVIITTENFTGAILNIVRNGRNGSPKGGNGKHTWCLHEDRQRRESICES